MVALLDIDDVIVAIGREPESPEETAQWQFYIEAISSFINSYVSVSFALIEGDVVRYEADYYGVIDLGGDPVSTVNSVKGWQSQAETTWMFNGIDRIFGLCSNEVVDVNYDHGYTAVPKDIVSLATQVVLGILGLGATGPVSSFTVGDITEVYSLSKSGQDVTVATFSKAVLDKYTDTCSSWRLGYSPNGDPYYNLPTL